MKNNSLLNRISIAFVIALFMALTFAMTSFAQGPGQGSVPFDIEFNTNGCERLCYAGHPGDKVVYQEGIALPTDVEFLIIPDVVKGPAVDISKLSGEITLLYENDEHTLCNREIIKKFEKGDFKKNEYYSLFSETTMDNLKSRNKLYSDTLKALEITLFYERKEKEIKKRYYVYVCDDRTYEDLISR